MKFYDSPMSGELEDNKPEDAVPRAVVTGGAGFLGYALCTRLIADGFDVICLDNRLTSNPQNVDDLKELDSIDFRDCDITEDLSISEKVDVVVHLASPASPHDYVKLPVETLMAGSLGTLACLQLARRDNARFILASSSEVYGEPSVSPQNEEYFGNVSPIGPRSMYDEAKRFAEALTMSYCKQNNVDGGILRIFNTYGPRMRLTDGRAVPTFIRQAMENTPITVTGNGQQTRSFCYVADLIEAIVRMINTDVRGPINIGNPEEVTILHLAKMVIKILDSSSEIEFVERPPHDPTQRRPDVGAAKREIDWAPVTSLTEGLEITTKWYSERYPKYC